MNAKRARQLAKTPDSCVVELKQDRILAISPAFLGNIKEGVDGTLAGEEGHYSPSAGGVVLAHGKAHLKSDVANVADDQPWLFVPVRLSTFVFRPDVGAVLNAVVNKRSRSHTGFILHDTINGALHHREGGEGDGLGVGDSITVKIIKSDVQGDLLALTAELCGHAATDGLSLEEPPCETSGKRKRQESDSGVEVHVEKPKKKKRKKHKESE